MAVDQGLQDEVQGIISRHQENIERLKRTIDLFQWNKGYVANCEEQITSYEDQIKVLKEGYKIQE